MNPRQLRTGPRGQGYLSDRAGAPRRVTGSRSPRRLPRCAGAPAALLEQLEPRALLTGEFNFSADEVYLSELVNRARSDPMAEGIRLGIDLTAGLTPQELARLVPQEPLALNSSLSIAARAHSLDMAERDFFDHINPDGHDPTWRAQNAGYTGVAGENIAAGYDSIDEVHAAWLESLGHRKNVLSLHSNFDNSFHYDEFGPGFAFTNIGPFFDYHTELFGAPAGGRTYILGVVYNDLNSNQFYNIGEGMVNVRVDVALAAAPLSTIATYTTTAAGNYQLAVLPGDYVVTFTNLDAGTRRTANVTVQTVNVKLDTLASQLASVADDYADFGDWNNAHVLTVEPGGNAAASGSIELNSDTDLFRYAAAATMGTIITASSQGSLDVSFSVYNSSGTLLGNSIDQGGGLSAYFSFTFVVGQSYYISVGSTGGTTSGDYTLNIEVQEETTYHAAEDARFSVGSGGTGQLAVAAPNPDHRPIVFTQNANGVWSVAQLVQASGSPEVSGDIVTWVDPKDGRNYAAARSGAGLLLFTNLAPGVWTYRNLTSEVLGSQNAGTTGQLVVLVGVDQIVRLGALLDNGDLILYQQTGAGSSGAYLWSFVNLAETHLRAQGEIMPTFAGGLISYVTSWNGLNIAGLDATGNIQVVWWAPGISLWHTNNLSSLTGAPPIVDGLSAYLTPWDGINLSGINAQGELSVTWWVPQFAGEWRTNNLTQEFSGPALQAASITSYVTTWGGLNIAGLNDQGDVTVYWWAPALTETGWQITNLSQQIEGAPLPLGRLTGHATVTGVLNIFGASGNGHVVRYHWAVGDLAWSTQDLTDLVG
ncbi:MAG: CAP domain-containing protein [Phycisphaerales bacterium]